MNHSSLAASEENLARLVFEAQTTLGKFPAGTANVFDRVRRFIRLYSQLNPKPGEAALLYQQFTPPTAQAREIGQRLIIGRLSKSAQYPNGADLAIEDSLMSRAHFAIHIADGFHILRDMQSRNGTYLNDDPARQEEAILKAGDVILAGASFFIFTGAPLKPAG